uniref:Uncharacterized protein n=1 Tax=Candidatus Criblamydia sequanensis CRIB-18 TaxID=1437425 RepID=A0A090E4D0_9BACT|nr:hypothetical protein [Criblamydia sequanensis]CDR35330.1 hypothetical protein CSEC_p0059 [Criblamydia sequanensis CRIB-18]
MDCFISGNPSSWLAGHPAGWFYSLLSIFPNGWMSVQIPKKNIFHLEDGIFLKISKERFN